MALPCVNHTAYIFDRGGKRQVVALSPLARVRWERVRDTMSTATADVAVPSEECRKELGLVEAGRHELVIFRGDRRVWEGPVTRITYEGNSISVEAKDVMHYVNRTIMRNEYDNRYPNNGKVLDRIQRIFTTELARKEAQDPPVNVLEHVQYLHAGDDRVWPGRHFDSIKLVQSIRAARNVDEINGLLQAMRVAYGFQAFGVPATTANPYGATYDLPSLAGKADVGTAGTLKEAVVAGIQALSKYPPEFFRRMSLKGFYFVENIALTNSPSGNIGGIAVDRTLYIDVLDLNTDMSLENIVHHELNHLMWTAFPASQAAMRDKWLAANPPGFSYNGWDYANPPFQTGWPTGFVRDYARHSIGEDMAEVAGALLATAFYQTLEMFIKTDPFLAKKVALFKAWIAEVSGGMISGDEYYKAVNTGKTITKVGPSGIKDAGTAAHTLPYEMTVFDHVDNYAQRGGMDYTVVGRSILFFDVRKKIGQTAMVTGDDFLGDPVITQYGMELSTIVAHTDGKGHFGLAGGADPYYGEWETLYQAYDEDAQRDGDEPPSVAELESQAKRTHDQSRLPPLVVRIPDNTSLNPNGVLTIEDLVPGVHIPLQAKLPGRTLSQMQKLDSMSVEEAAEGGEQVKVVLSPAPSLKYLEEDEV